jgi:CspA family cold shock protein
MPGYRGLAAGQLVEFEWEPAHQDGYAYRALRAWPQGRQPQEPTTYPGSGEGTGAYSSTLTITMNEPPLA